MCKLSCASSLAALGVALVATTGSAEPLVEPKELWSQNGRLEVNLVVSEARVELPFNLSFNARVYDGAFGGPTLRVRAGDMLAVNMINRLGDNDAEFEASATLNQYHAPNTTNLHTHGLHISSQGKADNVLLEVRPGEIFPYELPINPEHGAGTNWYHPHNHGSSFMQTNAGMAGALLVDDEPGSMPAALAAMEEHTLLVQNLDVDDLARGLAGSQGNGGSSLMDPDLANPEGITGSLLLVNGQFQPSVELIGGEIKRLRVINANAVQALYFGFDGGSAASRCSMHILALDGVYLERPRLEEAVVLASGARADIAVQCQTDRDGPVTQQRLTTIYDEQVNGRIGSFWEPKNGKEDKVQAFLAINVSPRPKGQAVMRFPATLPALPPYLRDLKARSMRAGGVDQMPTTSEVAFNIVDGVRLVNNVTFGPDSMVANVSLDELVQWEVRSDAVPSPGSAANQHPYHQHVNHFLVMNDDAIQPGLLYKEGDIRDTVPLANNTKATIRTLPRDYIGKALIHCHIISHGDTGMSSWVTINQ